MRPVEKPGTLTQGAPVFPGSSRLGIEPKTPGWMVQDRTTSPSARGIRVSGLTRIPSRAGQCLYCSSTCVCVYYCSTYYKETIIAKLFVNVLITSVSISTKRLSRSRLLGELLFITTVPNTKLCAWGKEDSRGHVLL
jgi:hypothetical protein